MERLFKEGDILVTGRFAFDAFVGNVKTPNAYVEALAIGAQFPQQIAEKAGVNQQRVSQIVGNTNFSKINTLLSQGRNMDYIEKH